METVDVECGVGAGDDLTLQAPPLFACNVKEGWRGTGKLLY